MLSISAFPLISSLTEPRRHYHAYGLKNKLHIQGSSILRNRQTCSHGGTFVTHQRPTAAQMRDGVEFANRGFQKHFNGKQFYYFGLIKRCNSIIE